jgi:hypothetical protein
VKNALKAKNVQTAAHFVQKPKSWYDKLCEEESGTEENSQQTRNLLLNGAEKYAIEKFKNWYSYHFIGYLPSGWNVSFRNDDVHPKERDLRKVLRVIGLKADAIRALKMNDVKDIATLNRTSKEWKTQGASETQKDGKLASQWQCWEEMGLTRSDASDIINFRHWYNFYVAGKKMKAGRLSSTVLSIITSFRSTNQETISRSQARRSICSMRSSISHRRGMITTTCCRKLQNQVM